MAARFETQSITVAVEQGASAAARSSTLANAARAGVADLIASGQAAPAYTRFVDGVRDASEDAVRPDGAILYQFAYMGEVVTFALAFLVTRSPFLSGRYAHGFMVSVNGRPVPATSFQADSVPGDAEIFIYNIEPYSRKVDVQLIGQRRMRFSVPPGLFDDAATAVSRQFGNLIRATRLYTLSFPGQVQGKNGRVVQYPALAISRR